MEREHVWIGSIRAGDETAHEQFVSWLSGPEGARMFRQYRLSGYELRQQGSRLVVRMTTSEPTAVIRFLRNPGAWPELWDFETNNPAAASLDGDVRVSWQANRD